jgi:hypothetical protein
MTIPLTFAAFSSDPSCTVIPHSDWSEKNSEVLMECAFGLKGKDFAIVACDGHVDFSIINFKKDEDKIKIVRYKSIRWNACA